MLFRVLPDIFVLPEFDNSPRSMNTRANISLLHEKTQNSCGENLKSNVYKKPPSRQREGGLRDLQLEPGELEAGVDYMIRQLREQLGD